MKNAMPSHWFEDTEIYQSHFLDDVPYPNLVMLETSSFCNLRCPMCPRTIGKSPSAGTSGKEFGNLDVELLDRLDDLFKHTRTIVLSWFGEPLINKNVAEIVRRLKKYGLQTHITTNGILLTESVATDLVQAGLDDLAISMDAARPDTYRQLRPGAELEAVVANILGLEQIKRQFGSRTPRLQVAYVVMPENVQQLPEMIKLVDRLGIRNFTIGPQDDFALTREFALDDRQALRAKAEAWQAFQEARELATCLGITLGVESTARFYHDIGDPPPEFDLPEALFRNDYTPEETKERGYRKGCGVPWLHTVIGYNGDVHPCCVSSRVLGNINDKPFREIWWGADYRAFRERLKSTNPPEECWMCRRAHWTGSHAVGELKDSMRVGAHEIHGQGWNAVENDVADGPFRRIDREATVFLSHKTESWLAAELGTHSPRGTICEIAVNGRSAGRFRVHLGWDKYYLRVDNAASPPILKVRIAGSDFAQLLIREMQMQKSDSRPWWKWILRKSPFVDMMGLMYATRYYVSLQLKRLKRVIQRECMTARAFAKGQKERFGSS